MTADLYRHATCSNAYPPEEMTIGTKFTALCGVNTEIMPAVHLFEKCPDCMALFGNYLNDEICPVCGLSGRTHDASRNRVN